MRHSQQCCHFSAQKWLARKPAGAKEDSRWVLEVDLGAFKRGMPRMKRTKTIGQGVDFLNRHLSSSLSRDPANGGINGSLFQYLKTLTYAGMDDSDSLQGTNSLQKDVCKQGFPAASARNRFICADNSHLCFPGSPLMLNGKLNSHFELWDALLKVEKMWETTDPKVQFASCCSNLCSTPALVKSAATM